MHRSFQHELIINKICIVETYLVIPLLREHVYGSETYLVIPLLREHVYGSETYLVIPLLRDQVPL